MCGRKSYQRFAGLGVALVLFVGIGVAIFLRAGRSRFPSSPPRTVHTGDQGAPRPIAADLSLAEVAVHAGFSDQSVFCLHFKRVVGVTPRQYRMSAKIA